MKIQMYIHNSYHSNARKWASGGLAFAGLTAFNVPTSTCFFIMICMSIFVVHGSTLVTILCLGLLININIIMQYNKNNKKYALIPSILLSSILTYYNVIAGPISFCYTLALMRDIYVENTESKEKKEKVKEI